jgi:hypothetical protein
MLYVADIVLLREALKMAASRHEAQARWVERNKVAPSPAELDHQTKAERMKDLRERLGSVKAVDLLVRKKA